MVYDKDNIIDRYVGYFLNQLKSCVDEIYVVVNSKEIIRGMENFEAATKVYYRENEGYDVGAFKDAIVNFIGIEKNEDVALFKKEEIDYIDVAKRRLFLAWEGLEKKTRKYIKEENLIAEFKER